ncbi:MAG: toll/interleukin-1 receptor domain-containing protein [Cyanothece sp. SIO2G6]|nr:toll/interleukin-1 receptor domain-containing protein [Cyanothece sp. SIO2G6]
MATLEPVSNQRPQILISYANADRATAKAIVDGLRSQHLNACLDTDELHPGDHWAEYMRTTISASAYFLPLLSNHSVQGYWMNHEVEAG